MTGGDPELDHALAQHPSAELSRYEGERVVGELPRGGEPFDLSDREV